MRTYILARAKEASTWRGIVYLLAAAGVPLAPALADAIVASGLAMAGLIAVLTADSK